MHHLEAGLVPVEGDFLSVPEGPLLLLTFWSPARQLAPSTLTRGVCLALSDKNTNTVIHNHLCNHDKASYCGCAAQNQQPEPQLEVVLTILERMHVL